MEIRTLIAISILPLTCAVPDGALSQAPPFFAPGAFRMVKKPLQALVKFGKGETLTLREAVKPPINGELL